LQAELFDGLNVGANYTWMTTEDANGAELVRRPRNVAGLTVNYGFLENKRANANLTLAYNGAQKDNAFGPTRQVTLDDYLLLNIALSYRINDYVQVYARGENLLNQQYQEVYSYGTPGIAGYGGLRVAFEPLKAIGLEK
jgi:vitamin B12 transporter